MYISPAIRRVAALVAQLVHILGVFQAGGVSAALIRHFGRLALVIHQGRMLFSLCQDRPEQFSILHILKQATRMGLSASLPRCFFISAILRRALFSLRLRNQFEHGLGAVLNGIGFQRPEQLAAARSGGRSSASVKVRAVISSCISTRASPGGRSSWRFQSGPPRLAAQRIGHQQHRLMQRQQLC